MLVAQLCLTLCDSMDCQTPLSMRFPRQEYWSGLPFPSPENLPDSLEGIEPPSLVLQPQSSTLFFQWEVVFSEWGCAASL